MGFVDTQAIAPRKGDLRGEGTPLSEGSRAPLLVDLPGDQMPLLIEMIVLSMN
jgi:hypothetical protein